MRQINKRRCHLREMYEEDFGRETAFRLWDLSHCILADNLHRIKWNLVENLNAFSGAKFHLLNVLVSQTMINKNHNCSLKRLLVLRIQIIEANKGKQEVKDFWDILCLLKSISLGGGREGRREEATGGSEKEVAKKDLPATSWLAEQGHMISATFPGHLLPWLAALPASIFILEVLGGGGKTKIFTFDSNSTSWVPVKFRCAKIYRDLSEYVFLL